MVDCPFRHGASYSQVDPHRDRNNPEQHNFRATRKSVLSLSQNKPFNIYKVMVDASFTIFRSLVRAAADDIIFSLMLHGFAWVWRGKEGKEGHRSSPWALQSQEGCSRWIQCWGWWRNLDFWSLPGTFELFYVVSRLNPCEASLGEMERIRIRTGPASCPWLHSC